MNLTMVVVMCVTHVAKTVINIKGTKLHRFVFIIMDLLNSFINKFLCNFSIQQQYTVTLQLLGDICFILSYYSILRPFFPYAMWTLPFSIIWTLFEFSVALSSFYRTLPHSSLHLFPFLLFSYLILMCVNICCLVIFLLLHSLYSSYFQLSAYTFLVHGYSYYFSENFIFNFSFCNNIWLVFLVFLYFRLS